MPSDASPNTTRLAGASARVAEGILGLPGQFRLGHPPGEP